MSDPGSPVPISDEQAKAIQEALKVLQGIGGFLRKTFGTVPEDLVGYFGGDYLKVRRAENAARIFQKAQVRLDARDAAPRQPSISLLVPLVIAAADEDRDELQEIWARLLAAAADPSRTKSFRLRFIEVTKQMDPLDAAVLRAAHERGEGVTGPIQNEIAGRLEVTADEVAISLDNLTRFQLMTNPIGSRNFYVSSFGREFLRAISD